MFNGWVKAGFWPKLTMDQRPGGLFISLLCRPAATAAKRRPAKRAYAKRLEKQRARCVSRQREQQVVAAAASAASPPPIRPHASYSNPLRQQGLHPLQRRQPPCYHQQRQPPCYHQQRQPPHYHQQRQPLRHYRQQLPQHPRPDNRHCNVFISVYRTNRNVRCTYLFCVSFSFFLSILNCVNIL